MHPTKAKGDIAAAKAILDSPRGYWIKKAYGKLGDLRQAHDED